MTPEEIVEHVEHTDNLLDLVKIESASVILILERLITAVEALATLIQQQANDGK